jgi:flagellar motor switch protein FliG
LALKICGDGLKEKLFVNMEGERAQSLVDDLEGMGPVRITEIEKSQKKIVTVHEALPVKTYLLRGNFNW